MNPTRRQVTWGLAWLLLAPWPALAASPNMSFDEFVILSERLLGWPVDRAVARRIFRLLAGEPWGMSHLLRIRRKLIRRGRWLAGGMASLDDGERWFLGHLLTTWVTGIYYHQRGNVMVTYAHALMHEALRDIRPVPGVSYREFGFWARPPGGKEQ